MTKGLELAEAYYKAYGQEMLRTKFPQVIGQTAVGLAGYGSECLGFDDEVSMDHDYGPSFVSGYPENCINSMEHRYRRHMRNCLRNLADTADV